MGSLSEDDQLKLALQLSLAEAEEKATGEPQLRGEYRLPRSAATPIEVRRSGGDDPAVADIYGVEGAVPPTGALLQINTFDQFNTKAFGASIEEFRSPASPCGLFTMAHAVLVPRLLAPFLKEDAAGDGAASARWPPRLSTEAIEALVSPRGGLRDLEVLLPELRAAMRWLHDKRQAWIQGHTDDFASDKDRAAYMKAWVANYEISDWLRERAPAGAALHFVRYNQWPEHPDATHEELLRLASEEQAFGGVRDEKSNIHFAEGEASFWVDSFERPDAGEGTLRWKRRAAEWRDFRRGTAAPPWLFPVDLDGHFVFCIACRLASKAPEGTDESVLLVINTTGSNYLPWPALTRTFDLAFLDAAG